MALLWPAVILLAFVTIQGAYSSPLLINAVDNRNDVRVFDLEYSDVEPQAWTEEQESSFNQVDARVPLRRKRATDDVIPTEDNTSINNNPQVVPPVTANSNQPTQNVPVPIPRSTVVPPTNPQSPQTNLQPTQNIPQSTLNNPQVSENNPQPTQTNPQPGQPDASVIVLTAVNAGLNFADQLALLGLNLNRRLHSRLDRIQGGVNTLVDNKVNAISDLIRSVLTTGGRFPTTGLRLAFEPLRFPVNVFG